MKKSLLRFLFCPLLLLLPVDIFAFTQTEENLIYSIKAFNGRTYFSTFCHEHSDTIYLLSNSDNFISMRKIFVYYWPITNNYRIDQTILNKQLPGTLVISENKRNTQISAVPISVVNKSDNLDIQILIYKGDEANRIYDQYKTEMKAYHDAVKEENERIKNLTEWQTAMLEKIKEYRSEGKNTAELAAEIEKSGWLSRYPMQIRRPDYVAESPIDAFLINLPAGEYKIQMIDAQGNVYENSEKKLIIYDMNSKNSVSYYYTSEDKITKQRESKYPDAVIYTTGASDIYFLCFLQNLFNDYKYQKMIVNDGYGNPGIGRWVRTKIISDSYVEVVQNRKRQTNLVIENFSIKLNPNSNDEYKIDYFDRSASVNGAPDFPAMFLPVSSENKVTTLKAKDFNDEYLTGGKRQVRIVNKNAPFFIVFVICSIPVILMIVILTMRVTLYRKKENS